MRSHRSTNRWSPISCCEKNETNAKSNSINLAVEYTAPHRKISVWSTTMPLARLCGVLRFQQNNDDSDFDFPYHIVLHLLYRTTALPATSYGPPDAVAWKLRQFTNGWWRGKFILSNLISDSCNFFTEPQYVGSIRRLVVWFSHTHRCYFVLRFHH